MQENAAHNIYLVSDSNHASVQGSNEIEDCQSHHVTVYSKKSDGVSYYYRSRTHVSLDANGTGIPGINARGNA